MVIFRFRAFFKGQWPKAVMVRELETISQVTFGGTETNYVEKRLGVKRDGAMITP